MISLPLMVVMTRQLCAPKWRPKSKPRKQLPRPPPKKKPKSKKSKSVVARRRNKKSVVKKRNASASLRRRPNVRDKRWRSRDACKRCKLSRCVLLSRHAPRSSFATVTIRKRSSHLPWKRTISLLWTEEISRTMARASLSKRPRLCSEMERKKRTSLPLMRTQVPRSKWAALAKRRSKDQPTRRPMAAPVAIHLALKIDLSQAGARSMTLAATRHSHLKTLTS